MELITTRQLAQKTGYSVNYIAGLVRDGVLVPAGMVGLSYGFLPNVIIAAKPKSGRRKADDPLVLLPSKPFTVCGGCEYHDRTHCTRTGQRAAYNRVACHYFRGDDLC